MNKGPDAFRTISEVAEDLDVPQHVLRFWETRFSTIRPLKRGGGRRYYRPDDIDLLKGIRQLLYGQGYTIRGVQRILKEGGLRFVQGIGRGEQQTPLTGPPVFGEPDADDMAPPAEWGNTDEDVRGGAAASPPAEPDDRPLFAPAGAPPPPRPALTGSDRDRLRAALDDLLACRRLLEGLKRS